MRFKLLGNSGLRVSELSLGTMTFGEEWGWGANAEVARQQFDTFAEAGGNFIDTADGYTGGTSERMVGEFVAGQREKFVIATKYTFNQRPGDPNAGGNHRKNLTQALEGSLRRLNLDYIDLYWVHAWDQLTPVEEVMRALDDVVRAGKVLYVGVSNWPAWRIAQANTLAEFRGWTSFVGLQIEYNLLKRTPERELIPMAHELGLGITPWSPLASGLLSGKYAKPQAAGEDDRRLDKTAFLAVTDQRLALAGLVTELAEEIGRSPAQVALNWVRQRHGCIPILGARTLEQLKDNLACLEFTLSEQQISRLDEASEIDPGYPDEFLNRVRDGLHGGTWYSTDRPYR
jgi:aryl-alcohol dehydrogenase-like predicted oxidoreductase